MVIESKRLILRSWEDGDIDDIVEGLNNINVSKWLASVPYPYTDNDAQNFIKRAKEQDENTKISLAIVLKENNKVIGGTEIRNINKKDGTAGGGIWLNEKYQKNGYGTEAFYTKIKYAFEVLGLRRMENGYFQNNEKSKRMQEKLGFKNEGIKRKKYLCLATGEYVDECITGLLKEDFVDIYNLQEIHIRDVKKEDIEEIAKMKIDGWRESYKNIIDEDFLKQLDVKKEIEKLTNNYNENHFIVATMNEKIIGFCRYSGILDDSDNIDSEIGALYVKTEFKRNGIGRKLFEYAVNEFKQLDKNKMIIWCLEENYPSRAFYEKMGGKIYNKKSIKFGEKNYWLVAYTYDI